MIELIASAAIGTQLYSYVDTRAFRSAAMRPAVRAERINSRRAPSEIRRRSTSSTLLPTVGRQSETASVDTSLKTLARIRSFDRVLGERKAPISFITYVDFQCKHCHSYHETVSKLYRNNKSDLNVVHRHFPLESIHSEAYSLALAAECSARSGGNASYWMFADSVLTDDTPTGDEIPKYLKRTSTDRADFDRCMKDEPFAYRIRSDGKRAKSAGARGTPWTIVVNRETGEISSFGGSLPYLQIKEIFDRSLR